MKKVKIIKGTTSLELEESVNNWLQSQPLSTIVNDIKFQTTYVKGQSEPQYVAMIIYSREPANTSKTVNKKG